MVLGQISSALEVGDFAGVCNKWNPDCHYYLSHRNRIMSMLAVLAPPSDWAH